MNQTVFFNFTDFVPPVNAFSVVLANEDKTPSDPGWGLRRIDTGEVIKAYGTSVDNPDTGVYSITFSALPGVVYAVSWEVVPFSGADPQYKIDKVGPFFEPEGVRVRAESKGTFTQGTFGALNMRVFDSKGNATDASSINLTIRHSADHTIVINDSPVKLGRGIYMFDWQIPGDQATGTYDVIWTYTVRGTTRVEYQQIEVAEATVNAPQSGIMAFMRIKLETMLAGIQTINLQTLQADDTQDLQTYSFPFQHWNQSAGVKVYRGQKLVRSGYEIDYYNGLVIFDKKQLEEDQIHVSCVFRFFSDDDLDYFLFQGLNAFNIFPPHTGTMTYNNIPQHYVPPVMYGAAIEGIRTFMSHLIWPKNRALFETGEAADKAFDHYNTIKENYEKQWQTLSEQKKLFPYAGLNALILQPMYTLPGGRARFFRYLFGGGF